MSAPALDGAVVIRTGTSSVRLRAIVPPYVGIASADPPRPAVVRGGSRFGWGPGEVTSIGPPLAPSTAPPEAPMSNRTYRVTELVGTSPDGIDAAIRNAVRRASTTLRHVDWFEVTQVRGQVKDGDVEHFQVGLKVGFRLEDD